MSLGRSVPWTCWEEWHQVGDWLQSKEASAVQKGLDRVATWRSRGRVPLGVDSTACFVETRLRDESGDLAQLPLRMQYSLAVVRMVNGIADSSQKGRMAASVASLTAAAGLPRLLVDLRHEATHNELPSLAALQLAAHHALTWLRINYWQKQSDHIDLNKAKISGIIGDYVGSHMAAAIKAAAATQKQDYDSDEEEEEDEEDNGGGNGGGGTNQKNIISGDYNVAEARKQRQALLTELRVAVPAPATHLLIDGLLQAQITASKESSSAVVVRALTHAMKHLLQEGWNQLPARLLNTAAVALGKIETSSTTNLVVAPPTFSMLDVADWNIWLEVLAPQGRIPSLPEAAARSIIATSLVSFSEIEQAPLNRWLHQNSVTDEGMATADFDDFEDERSKEEGDVARAASLKRLLEVILLCLDDKDLKQRCLAMAARVQDSINNQTKQKAEAAVAAAPQNNSLEIVADLQRLSYEVLHLGKDTSTLKRPRSVVEDTRTTEGTIDDKGVENNKQKKQQQPRFTRCLNWQPCAIGMLPNAVDSNGKIPRLELRTGIQLRDLPKEDVGAGLVTFGGGGGGGGGGEAVAMTFEEEEQLDGNSDAMTLEGDEEDEDGILNDAEEEEEEGGLALPGNAVAAGRCPPPPSIRPFI